MANAYDRLRRLRSIDDNLIVRRAIATGYADVPGSPIKKSWYIEDVQDFRTGDQYKQILIAEDGAWQTSMLDAATVMVANGLRYKVSVIKRPEAAPKCWVLRGDPL